MRRIIKYPGRYTQFLKEYYDGKPLILAEIGVLNGDHAVEMLETLNVQQLYLIDPYSAYEDYHDHNRHGLEDAYKKATSRMMRYGNRIQWIFKPSDRAFRFIHTKLDGVYIDGNHAAPYVRNDLYAYGNLVYWGGIIGGHDYYSRSDPDNLCGVKEVVDEFQGLTDSQLYLDGSYEHDWPDWWFIKDDIIDQTLRKDKRK